jgi:2-succinyl-5-enolpyruvyl-6-hydroxy-3-cyclohexene-1-carboxylate synthase
MPQDVHFATRRRCSPEISSPGLEGAGCGAGRRLARPGATLIELVVNETDGTQTLQQLLAQVSQL